MVTGIFELVLAYQTVQPFIALQIQLIKDTYSMVVKIREVVKEYKARFVAHRTLVLDLDHQFLRLNVLSEALEQLCSGNTLADANRIYIDSKLKALQSDLEGMEDRLRKFLERMTLDNDRLLGMPENKKSKSKKLLAGVDFVMEGREQLQAALDMSNSWIRSITSEFTFMMVMDSHKVLVGTNRRGGMVAGEIAKEKDKTNYYESFRTLNVEKVSLDTPIARHMKRIMIARQKAKALDDVTKDELEAKLISEYELSYEKDIEILENDSDLEFGRKLEVVKGTADKFQYHLVDSRLFETDNTYEQSLRETLFLSAMLSSDDDRADEDEDEGPLGSLDQDIGRLPKCVGVIKRYNEYPQRFDLIFELPSNTHPRVRTLRKALTDPDTINNPIDDRYSLSLHLAQSLFLIHSAGLIHRQIRPECVLLTDNLSDKPEDKYPNRLGRPFLFGFGQTREDNGTTKRVTFDTHPRRALAYRPPRHQGYGSTRPDRYRMIDDIYSLGVTLLEIGLWKSLFQPHDSTYAEDDSVFKFKSLSPSEILDKLIKKAEKEVPRKLGTAYTKVVVSCLECFSNKSGFGNVDEKPGELLRKYEKIVLEPLRELVIRTSIGY